MVLIHIFILCTTAVFILLSDHEAYLWLTGKKQTLDSTKIYRYHYLVFIGLCLMITTGLIMFWPMHTFLLTEGVFQLKMMFVAILIINSFAIGKLIRVATTRPFATLSTREKIPLFVSGGLSTIAWIGAATLAFFLL